MNNDHPDYLRRRLLTALALTPLLPAWPAAAQTPDTARILSLEWLPTELLLALGVTPMGVADIRNYNLWVQAPALPASVRDLGTRTEPNMELVQQLNPSLLLYSNGFGTPPEMLGRIAPAQGFSFNDGSGHPLPLAMQSLRQLAATLGLENRAQAHLARVEQHLQQAHEQLRAWRAVPLLLFTLMNAGSALVLGRGSLFADVMARLELTNAWQGETNFWGSAVVSIEQLAAIDDAQGIFFSHGNEGLLRQVQQTPLWRALPFVRKRPVQVQPAVWFYGATLSAMRFCDLLGHALGERP
ncbi:Fe(3+)-hydroxamate ABC transporter substrate-binding protein FhuD [Enterobacillus tribolii]|uniref:Iron complex transport system substrate-binding protein n=1 Tax=Enterobacillus tribolii TaxID=1487935 RepID=A0A370QPX8_9GAMM|nr:Fe(3+)-hydroxamate ABC transporter substrate-binding protein FhuD [Enterobacillus tribolii]MBW7981444.1 Fe(3+)-hydroxamate ABC transporter substrate-binding protein FhuD [Enterobacillus tribolii]RDK90820.1 iron complex transport system substrate-binding protein [Enterobacillus tribolii]